MITFIKKIKTKTGINSFDNEKIKKEIPEGYKASLPEPVMTFTGNHIIIAFQCERTTKPDPKSKVKRKANASKKVVARKE